MYNRDSSDGQKQLILGSISLAVRELAGWPTTATEPLATPTAAVADNNNVRKNFHFRDETKLTTSM